MDTQPAVEPFTIPAHLSGTFPAPFILGPVDGQTLEVAGLLMYGPDGPVDPPEIVRVTLADGSAHWYRLESGDDLQDVPPPPVYLWHRSTPHNPAYELQRREFALTLAIGRERSQGNATR